MFTQEEIHLIILALSRDKRAVQNGNMSLLEKKIRREEIDLLTVKLVQMAKQL